MNKQKYIKLLKLIDDLTLLEMQVEAEKERLTAGQVIGEAGYQLEDEISLLKASKGYLQEIIRRSK